MAPARWYADSAPCVRIDDQQGDPKVAGLYRKKTFSLRNKLILNGDTDQIETYSVRVDGGMVYIGL